MEDKGEMSYHNRSISPLLVLLCSVAWFLILPLQYIDQVSYCHDKVCMRGYDFTFLSAHPWRWFGGYHTFVQFFEHMSTSHYLRHLAMYSVAHDWQVWLFIPVSVLFGIMTAKVLTILWRAGR